MKLFRCQHCSNRLYFENTICEQCNHSLGYIPDHQTLTAVEPNGENWLALADSTQSYRFCANWELRACNWLVSTESGSPYCVACQHNDVVPDVSDPKNHVLWQKLETAKRRLFYSIIRLQLPIPLRADGVAEPLEFRFLSDMPGRKVMTGHENGIITISLNEADDGTREKLRTNMNEPYRTLLGHLRHEVGHFYWDLLVRDTGKFDAFRAVFGDERASYDEALKRHHSEGAPPDWQTHFVSSYATMHPWEDFAETWAHYLHICDTLEMAQEFGLSINPTVTVATDRDVSVKCNAYDATDFKTVVDDWLPITFAVNSLNRAMGQPDLYPFVVTEPVVQKLEYIRQLVHSHRGVL